MADFKVKISSCLSHLHKNAHCYYIRNIYLTYSDKSIRLEDEVFFAVSVRVGVTISQK